MRSLIAKNSLLVALLLSFLSAFAQEEDNKLRTSFEIVKSAPIELPPANRNFEKITYQPPKSAYKPQQYNTTKDVGIRLPKLDSKIQILTLKPLPLKPLYGNYIKVGAGNYGTAYADVFLNNKRSDQFSYGIHLKQLSSAHGPVDKSNSGVSNTSAEGYVRYYMGNVVLSGDMGYYRNRYNYYGYNNGSPVNMDTINQSTLKLLYNTFHVNVGLQNINQDAAFKYNANLGYYNISNNRSSSESEVLLTNSSTYTIDQTKSIQSSSTLSVTQYKADSHSINRDFYQVKPKFVMQAEKYILRAGVNVAYTNDTVNTKLHIYPSVNVDYMLMDKTVIAFVGVDGEMQKNTFRSFVAQNPFLQNNVPLLHTNKALELYAGLKGNLTQRVNYKAQLSYLSYKYLSFFNNNFASDASKFNILYARGTSTVVNFNAELTYEQSERFRFGALVNSYSYNVSSDVGQALQRPTFTTTLLATYNIQKKIFFNANIYYISGLKAENTVNKQMIGMPNITDVSVKVDYQISNVFSAFVEFNNILSKKYQRYLYYSVKGFNTIAGLSYSF